MIRAFWHHPASCADPSIDWRRVIARNNVDLVFRIANASTTRLDGPRIRGWCFTTMNGGERCCAGTVRALYSSTRAPVSNGATTAVGSNRGACAAAKSRARATMLHGRTPSVSIAMPSMLR
jgi:hypothetical protein